MKKKFLLLFLLLFITLPTNIKALSVDKNNITIEKGKNDNIALYANLENEVTEIAFTLVYTSYDLPAYFNLEPGLTDTNPNGVAHKIKFSTPVSGKVKLGTINIQAVKNPKVTAGTINIHSAKATTEAGINQTLKAQTINVIIGTPTEEPIENNDNDIQNEPKETEKKTNLLDKIESELVKVNLKKDTYEYTITIKDNVEELDLKAIPKDEKYEVEVSTQKISELKDNKITIKVKDGDNTEEYIIKVKIQEEKELDVKIDNKEFESNNSYKGKWITVIIIMSIVLFAGVLLNKKK